ncbi:MAG: translation elongation factor Ts [Alphaproteobacteria bacterium]|nr:translation elongation factor Ts [Alphaproteobacteria bacterium]
MTAITASAVKELRQKSGAGMMDCKKALNETNGNIEDAMDWLRTKGLASAAKKSGRAAAEGLVGIASNGTVGVVVEVNAETDFVSRNEGFQKYVQTVTDLALEQGESVETLGATDYPGTGRTVAEELTHLISVIGENMNLRRVKRFSVEKGIVTNYLHNATTDTLGQIGVLVALESDADATELTVLGKQIAMHIAAANPKSHTKEDLDPTLVERERAIYKEQVIASGKPAEFADKIVEGRLRKFYEESVLCEQIYMIDDTKRTVAQVVADKAKELGTDINFKGYAQFRLGEGIEKKEEDFAAEVAAQLAK